MPHSKLSLEFAEYTARCFRPKAWGRAKFPFEECALIRLVRVRARERILFPSFLNRRCAKDQTPEDQVWSAIKDKDGH